MTKKEILKIIKELKYDIFYLSIEINNKYNNTCNHEFLRLEDAIADIEIEIKNKKD